MSLSERSNDWLVFSNDVVIHIEEYTVPQYGDKGSDQANDFTPEECVLQIKKYANRHGRNSRPGQEKLDLLKIAHYAQLAYTKLQEQEDAQR